MQNTSSITDTSQTQPQPKKLAEYVQKVLDHESSGLTPGTVEGKKLNSAVFDGRALASKLASKNLELKSIDLGKLGPYYTDESVEAALNKHKGNKEVFHLISEVITNQFDRIASFIEQVAKLSGTAEKFHSHSFTTEEGYRFSIDNKAMPLKHAQRAFSRYSANFGNNFINKFYEHHTSESSGIKDYQWSPNAYGWQAGSYGEVISIGHQEDGRFSPTTSLKYELGVTPPKKVNGLERGYMEERIYRTPRSSGTYKLESPTEEDYEKIAERARTAFNAPAWFLFYGPDGN